MPGVCMLPLRADHRAGRQRAMHPAQASLCDFHPTLTDRRQAAFLECLAIAIGVQPHKVAVTGLWHE